MRTPFFAALLSASIAWAPLSSATAQQVTERQTAFESLCGQPMDPPGCPRGRTA